MSIDARASRWQGPCAHADCRRWGRSMFALGECLGKSEVESESQVATAPPSALGASAPLGPRLGAAPKPAGDERQLDISRPRSS